MGGNVAENLSNQSVPEAAARVAAVVNRLVNRIGSNAESRERLAEIEIPEELRDNLALFLRLERRVLSEYDPEIADLFDKILSAEIVANAGNANACAPAPPVAVPPTRPSTSRACPPPTSPLLWRFARSSI